MSHAEICPGPTRRSVLQLGLSLLGGLGLNDLLRLRANAAARERDTAVILLWVPGGMSHLETFDPKPDAPAEYRGEFDSIATKVPGVRFCEHLPRLAQLADKLAVIRSISHNISDHPGAAGRFLSGRIPPNISAVDSKFPTIDAVVGKLRHRGGGNMPALVSNTPQIKGAGPAYLGQSARPFVVDADPNLADFEVPNLTVHSAHAQRLEERMQLLSELDRYPRGRELDGSMQAADELHRRAMGLLSSNQARQAFQIAREPASVRDRYGRHEWGQRALLARRLVEAGSSFVTVELRAKKPYELVTWDDHGDVYHIFRAMQKRLPLLDRTASALIEDIYERGLDRRVLVVIATEFGRTPKINMGRAAQPKNPGRDHWPGAMSVVVSGGGLPMGQVIGATNSKGEMPQQRPLQPNDFLATVYRFLGIDTTRAFLDPSGRPMPVLPWGKPIEELGG